MKHPKIWRTAGILTGGVALIVGGYAAYLFIDYHRLPDNLKLSAENNQSEIVKVGTTYHAQTFNIGYGSYPPSYSFFMDGGKYSRAYSKSAVEKAIDGDIDNTKHDTPDFAFFQEVDTTGQRSQNVDEVAKITKAFSSTHGHVFGQNYDTPYLFYPFNQPIGAAKSGLLTLTNKKVSRARRYSLPIETNLNKFTDLDRAFTVTTLPTDNGHHLELVNIHMSAFTKDRSIQNAQFEKLFSYIKRSYAKGNYVIVAGDYNHRLLKNAPEIFSTTNHEETWTHLFPFSKLPTGFYVPTMGLAEAKVPSVRALDKPYSNQSFVTLVDGYILSPNVAAEPVHVFNAGFKDSDHNPVRLTFRLK